MALIDLTVEKPALKRTELTEVTGESDAPDGADPVAVAVDPDTAPASGGRLRRTAGVVGAVAVGVVGLFTLRKIRTRRRNGDAEE